MAGPPIEAELPPESGSEKGRLRGTVVASGQLSSENGLREVLQRIRQMEDMPDMRCILLRILSRTVRGYIGITDATTITGAHVTSTREYGLTALKKLLAANKGLFVVMSMSDHPNELRQAMKLPIQGLVEYNTPGAKCTLNDALIFFATRYADVFTIDKAAEEAATTGGDLADFESYMAWGGDAPVLANNLSKLATTGSFLKPKSGAQSAAQPASPPPQQQPPQQQQPQQQQQPGQPPQFQRVVAQNTPQPEMPPAPPSASQITPAFGWGADQSKQVMADLDKASKSALKTTQGIPMEMIDPDAVKTAAAKPTAPKKKEKRVRTDDDQSISQKISKLREEQTASQKLRLEDLEDLGKPVNVLSPAERKRHEMIQIAMWTAGLLLFFALGNQVFNISNATAKYRSGMAALKKGDNARAQVELTTAINNGAGPRAYLYRGIAESRLGHKDKAMEDFDRLVAADPKDALARAARASHLTREKKFNDAIADCDAILSFNPNFGEAWRLKALAYCAQGNYKEALDTTSNGLQTKLKDKERADLYAARAFADFKVKRYQDAIKDYSEAITLNPSNGSLFASRALAYKKDNKWAFALSDAKTAVTLDPSNATLYKLRAECYKHAGDIAKAADDLDTATKLQPSMDAFKLRAVYRLAAKKFQDAMEDFEYIMSVEPTNKQAKEGYEAAKKGMLSGLPVALSELARMETAVPKAIVIRGSVPELVSKGYAKMRAGELEDAVAYLTAAVRGAPGDVQARRYLSYALVERKDYQSAAAEFGALGKMTQLTTEDNVQFGKALYNCKRFSEATQVYGQAVSADPNSDVARQGLINSLIEGGQPQLAVQLCQEGMTRNPKMGPVYQLLMKTALHPVSR